MSAGQPTRARLAAIAAALVVTAAGLVLRRGVDGAVAKYGGVALWAALVYCLVVVVAPTSLAPRAAMAALAVSWAVELAQLTPVPAWLSSKHVVLRLVFGTTFHWPDLPSYAAGVALAAAVHSGLRRGR